MAASEPRETLYEPAFSPEWLLKDLHSLASWTNGMAFTKSHFSPVGTPIVKIAEVKNGVTSQTKFTDVQLDSRYSLEDQDLLFCWSGQPETSIDAYRWAGGPGWLNQHIFRVLPDPGLVDNDYFFYLLRYLRPTFVRIARNKQTTGLGHVTKGDLQRLTVGVPPRDVQKSIATALSMIDGKLNSNARRLALLLRLSSEVVRLAKDMAGIRHVCLGDVADFHNRRRVPLARREREARLGPYPYYGATGVFGYVDDFLFDEVLALVGEDGSVVNVDGSPVTQYIWGKSWINNHAHPLSGRGISTELLFLALCGSDVRPLVTGAVQAKVSMGSLRSLPLQLPAGDIAILEAKIGIIFASYRQLVEENRILQRTFDALIPELVSGRLRLGLGAASELDLVEVQK